MIYCQTPKTNHHLCKVCERAKGIRYEGGAIKAGQKSAKLKPYGEGCESFLYYPIKGSM